MTVYDLEGVRMLEKMGFSRVVLARELTLEQAARIARNTGQVGYSCMGRCVSATRDSAS